jgi:hypothetical protein
VLWPASTDCHTADTCWNSCTAVALSALPSSASGCSSWCQVRVWVSPGLGIGMHAPTLCAVEGVLHTQKLAGLSSATSLKQVGLLPNSYMYLSQPSCRWKYSAGATHTRTACTNHKHKRHHSTGFTCRCQPACTSSARLPTFVHFHWIMPDPASPALQVPPESHHECDTAPIRCWGRTSPRDHTWSTHTGSRRPESLYM